MGFGTWLVDAVMGGGQSKSPAPAQLVTGAGQSQSSQPASNPSASEVEDFSMRKLGTIMQALSAKEQQVMHEASQTLCVAHTLSAGGDGLDGVHEEEGRRA